MTCIYFAKIGLLLPFHPKWVTLSWFIYIAQQGTQALHPLEPSRFVVIDRREDYPTNPRNV